MFTFQEYFPPQHINRLDTDFLEWFVGFAEGDGCWYVKQEGTKKRLVFEIIQKDPQLLYKIRKKLGYGRVSSVPGNEDSWKYQVADRLGIQRLLSLFQGNLVLPKRILQFQQWRAVALNLGLVPTSLLHTPVCPKKPSLHTAWFAGFLEAEGCFYAHLSYPKPGIGKLHWRQKFTLTQQDLAGEQSVLALINDFCQSQGAVRLVKEPNCYRIELCSIESHMILEAYLKRFPLQGKKHLASQRWVRVLNRRQTEKQVVSDKTFKKWKKVCKEINEQSQSL